MNHPATLRRILASALAFALAFGAAPAYGVTIAAVHADPVPSHAMVGTRDLFGLSDAVARAAITTGCAVPSLRSIVVKANGHVLRFTPTGVVTVNVDATLDKAYSVVDTVTPFKLKPVYAINYSKLYAWATKVARVANNKSVNARWVVYRKKALRLYAERSGHSVYKTKTALKMQSVLRSELASRGLVPKPMYAEIKIIKAKVTRRNIPKAILIKQSTFKLKLYARSGKLQKRYSVAVGTKAHPTPNGRFKVTHKVKNPVWHNPGSAWAAKMPQTIAGGPNNPLGTRAMYLNAPGIRIHGVPTSEDGSIGHRASHGCIRMHRGNVEALYPLVPVGTTVIIIK